MTEQTETTAGEIVYEWAIVEIMGHRKLAGRTREEERFGAKMLRIDIPKVGIGEGGVLLVEGWTTQFYGGASLFSFTLCDEATVLNANKPYVSPYRLEHQECPDDEDPFDL